MPKSVVIILGVVVSLISVFLILVSVSSIRKSLKEGPRPTGMPRSYRCTINVIQGDQPLEGATVTLHPEDNDLNKWGTITGTTDAKGNADINIVGASTYQGAFKGQYKVTITKYERQTLGGDIEFISFVPSEFSNIRETPATLTVSRSTKGKIDLGPPVRIEKKSFQAQRKEDMEKRFKVIFPCKITILNNGKPVRNAEVELKPKDFSKYIEFMIDFKGTTNERGEASIKPESKFSNSRDQMTFKEGMPADTFEVSVRIKDAKDFELSTGKTLKEITIVDRAVEMELDLKDYPSRFSF